MKGKLSFTFTIFFAANTFTYTANIVDILTHKCLKINLNLKAIVQDKKKKRSCF